MQLEDIAKKIREFRDARDWAQFHNPKDMAIAISIESSELLEHFLWKNPEEVEDRIKENLAVFCPVKNRSPFLQSGNQLQRHGHRGSIRYKHIMRCE